LAKIKQTKTKIKLKMMERVWQVMGKLKEPPKEKRFNVGTEHTVVLMDKPMSANYARIYHIIKSQNPLVTYVGPVAKYLNCECFYNGKKEGFSASCCTNPKRPEEADLTKVDVPSGTSLLVAIKVNGVVYEKKTKFLSAATEPWYEWTRKDGNPLYFDKLFMDGLFEHEREALDFTD
jgi:hypothetical protein